MNKRTVDPDLETTAYHEAGHIVMVYLLGQRVQGCTIEGNGVGEGWVSIERDGVKIDAAILETAARIGLGGLAAERKLSNRASIGGVHDLVFVLAFLECRDILEEDDGIAVFADTLEILLDYERGITAVRELGERHREAFRQMLLETGVAIEDNWLLVKSIAAALLEQGTLNSSQVKTLIASG